MSSKMQVLLKKIAVQKELDFLEKVSSIMDSLVFEAILSRVYEDFLAEIYIESDYKVEVVEQSIADIDVKGRRVILTPPYIPFYGYDEIAHKINNTAWGTTVVWHVAIEREYKGVKFVIQHEQYINLPNEEVELLKAMGKAQYNEPTPELNILCG